MSPRIGLDRNKIMQTAAQLADATGFETITLASLAKELKIQTPSLYNHFNGLAGLREELVEYGFSMLRESIALAAVGKSGDDAVHALAAAYISFVRLHPGLYQATLSIVPNESDKLKKEKGEIVDIVIRVLNAYGLDEQDSIHATRGLRSILHGFASLEQCNGFGLPQKVDESLAFTIDAFLEGLIKKENA